MKHYKQTPILGVLMAMGMIFFIWLPALADENTMAKDVKEKMGAAVEAIQNYTIDKKDQAVKDVDRVLEDLDRRIQVLGDRLDAKWDKLDAAAREKARQNMRKAAKKEKRSELNGPEGSPTVPKQAWDEVKTGFSDAYKALGESLQEAENQF